MTFLPITLNITDKTILLIGGGRIASHKIQFLSQFTKNIKIVAEEVVEKIKADGYEYIEKSYEAADLKGAFLIYACTNIKELNQRVKADAERLGILCNVVDNPKECDFVSPAIYKRGIYTVACGSNGKDVYKSIEIRDKIKQLFDNDPTFYHTAKYKCH